MDGAIVVPEFEGPLNEEQQAELQLLIDQSDAHTDIRDLYLLCREYVLAALPGV